MRNRMRPLICLLTAAALALAGCHTRPEWSTESETALAELRQGLEAVMRVYQHDATGHFERAIELDPDFVAAKLFLLEFSHDPERRAELLAQLRASDPEALTERERFLLQHRLALADGEVEAAESIRAAYLERHPEDPWALAICSRSAWDAQDLERAEVFYRDLLEADPNWVLAQNHLGYLAMARGDFDVAEERFKTYAYIAPDQANPYDSMGELLALLGRYDEARASLKEAIAIKSDFCHSYLWLQMVEILDGDPAASRPWIDAAREAGCSEEFVRRLDCQRAVWQAYDDGDWQAPWRDGLGPGCEDWLDWHHLIHRMALYTGRPEVALAIEERLAQAIEEGEGPPMEHRLSRAMLMHLRGFRGIFEGDAGGAVELLAAADDTLGYWGGNQGVVKLYNKLHLALALEEAGKLERSAAVRAEVEKVNAAFGAYYDPLRRQIREARAGA